MELERRPISLRAANRFIVAHHRHNQEVRGWLFGTSLWLGDELRSVGIAGRPVGRGFDDGLTVEILRVCTLGDKNACSMLYGALCRAAKALGYRRAVTYTLTEEGGTSPAAAGFVIDAELRARESWANEQRHRYDENLFGQERRPQGPKLRWTLILAKERRPVEDVTERDDQPLGYCPIDGMPANWAGPEGEAVACEACNWTGGVFDLVAEPAEATDSHQG